MDSSAHLAHRDQPAIRRGERADYLLTLQVAGHAEIDQDGRRALLRPGDLAFYDSTRPVTVLSGAGYRGVCLRFPRALTRTSPDTLGALTATTIRGDQGLAPVVAGALHGLRRSLARTQPIRAALDATRHTVALAHAMIGAELEVRGVRPLDPRRALRERVERYIDRHLGDADLSPARIAAAHHVSLRLLHSLFEDAETTVAATVRARRLERCLTDLADPWLADVPVSAVATRWGIVNPSRFAQLCKQATGLTPAQYRRAQLSAPR
jgi:AraC-like DNA-binding protein